MVGYLVLSRREGETGSCATVLNEKVRAGRSSRGRRVRELRRMDQGGLTIAPRTTSGSGTGSQGLRCQRSPSKKAPAVFVKLQHWDGQG